MIEIITIFIQSEAGQIISFASGIASIVGLFFAFRQIRNDKTKLAATQTALAEMREVILDQKTDVLLQLVINQEEELERLIGSLSKQGYSEKAIKSDLQRIVDELNKLDNQIPEKHKEVSDSIISAIMELRKEMNGDNRKSTLLEADGYLKVAIHGMRAIVDSGTDKKIEIISRANSK